MVIIRSIVKTVVRVDPDIEDLVPAYLENRANEHVLFTRFVDMADFEKIQNLAHKIRGTAGAYGFKELSVIAATVESLAKQKDVEKIRFELDHFKQYLESIELTHSA